MRSGEVAVGRRWRPLAVVAALAAEANLRSVQGLECHGARHVRHARGWYAYGVRTVRGALG